MKDKIWFKVILWILAIIGMTAFVIITAISITILVLDVTDTSTGALMPFVEKLKMVLIFYVFFGIPGYVLFHFTSKALKKPKQKDASEVAFHKIYTASDKTFLDLYDALNEKSAQIKDLKMKGLIFEINSTAKDVERFKGEDTSNEHSIASFGTYYIPTLIKLLDSFVSLEQVESETKEQIEMKEEILSAVSLISDAFKKLLDNMFETKAIDISTEKSVLESLRSANEIKDLTKEENREGFY